jgi:hypothetical protein
LVAAKWLQVRENRMAGALLKILLNSIVKAVSSTASVKAASVKGAFHHLPALP